MTSPLKIIFAGTPVFAATILESLINSEHNICAVYTQPDRPAGRGRKLTGSAVKQLAVEHQIPVMQPASLKDSDAQAQLRSYEADLMIVVAYGLLLPKAVLDIPRLGCINVHASLLPRWRGAAPIQRCLLAGDQQTGITLIQMDEGLDTGDMLALFPYNIAHTDTTESLHITLAQIGADGLLPTLDKLNQGLITPIKQDHENTIYAAKISKTEALIDWMQPAHIIERMVRAFNAWPVAYTTLPSGDRLRIWQAEISPIKHSAVPGSIIQIDKNSFDVATHEGALRILKVQLSGKSPVDSQAFLNASPLSLDDCLGQITSQ